MGRIHPTGSSKDAAAKILCSLQMCLLQLQVMVHFWATSGRARVSWAAGDNLQPLRPLCSVPTLPSLCSARWVGKHDYSHFTDGRIKFAAACPEREGMALTPSLVSFLEMCIRVGEDLLSEVTGTGRGVKLPVGIRWQRFQSGSAGSVSSAATRWQRDCTQLRVGSPWGPGGDGQG